MTDRQIARVQTALPHFTTWRWHNNCASQWVCKEITRNKNKKKRNKLKTYGKKQQNIKTARSIGKYQKRIWVCLLQDIWWIAWVFMSVYFNTFYLKAKKEEKEKMPALLNGQQLNARISHTIILICMFVKFLLWKNHDCIITVDVQCSNVLLLKCYHIFFVLLLWLLLLYLLFLYSITI